MCGHVLVTIYRSIGGAVFFFYFFIFFYFFFFVVRFDNQFLIYKPSYVPNVSLTISTVEILQDYYFKANFIKIFARFKSLTLNTYIF